MSIDRYDRLVTIIASIAEVHPNLPAVDFLPLVRKTEEKLAEADAETDYLKRLGVECPSATASLRVRAAWIATQPDILMYLPGKKINAIKECRARSSWGLKEAKDAVEAFMEGRHL